MDPPRRPGPAVVSPNREAGLSIDARRQSKAQWQSLAGPRLARSTCGPPIATRRARGLDVYDTASQYAEPPRRPRPAGRWFTAGVAETTTASGRVCAGLEGLGVMLDPKRNRGRSVGADNLGRRQPVAVGRDPNEGEIDEQTLAVVDGLSQRARGRSRGHGGRCGLLGHGQQLGQRLSRSTCRAAARTPGRRARRSAAVERRDAHGPRRDGWNTAATARCAARPGRSRGRSGRGRARPRRRAAAQQHRGRRRRR